MTGGKNGTGSACFHGCSGAEFDPPSGHMSAEKSLCSSAGVKKMGVPVLLFSYVTGAGFFSPIQRGVIRQLFSFHDLRMIPSVSSFFDRGWMKFFQFFSFFHACFSRRHHHFQKARPRQFCRGDTYIQCFWTKERVSCAAATVGPWKKLERELKKCRPAERSLFFEGWKNLNHRGSRSYCLAIHHPLALTRKFLQVMQKNEAVGRKKNRCSCPSQSSPKFLQKFLELICAGRG